MESVREVAARLFQGEPLEEDRATTRALAHRWAGATKALFAAVNAEEAQRRLVDDERNSPGRDSPQQPRLFDPRSESQSARRTAASLYAFYERPRDVEIQQRAAAAFVRLLQAVVRRELDFTQEKSALGTTFTINRAELLKLGVTPPGIPTSLELQSLKIILMTGGMPLSYSGALRYFHGPRKALGVPEIVIIAWYADASMLGDVVIRDADEAVALLLRRHRTTFVHEYTHYLDMIAPHGVPAYTSSKRVGFSHAQMVRDYGRDAALRAQRLGGEVDDRGSEMSRLPPTMIANENPLELSANVHGAVWPHFADIQTAIAEVAAGNMSVTAGRMWLRERGRLSFPEFARNFQGDLPARFPSQGIRQRVY